MTGIGAETASGGAAHSAGPLLRVVTGALRHALAREAEARSGFHLLPAGLMLGIICFHGLSWRLPAALSAACIVALAYACAVIPTRPGLRLVLAFLAAVAAGQALCRLELLLTRTTILSGSATVSIAGRVALRESDATGRMRYVIDVERTRQPVLSRPPERIRLAVSSRHRPIPVGGTYEGLVKLGPPSGPAFPGAHDFAFGPYFDGIGANGFALGPPQAAPAAGPEGVTLAERLVRLRVAISERVRQVIAGPEGAVAAALISGERAGIPKRVDDDLRVTGLSHILSISGFHMALVAGLVLAAARMGLALWPRVGAALPVKKIGALAALLTTAAYLAIAGPNVATERSFFMIAIMLGSVLVDRPALTLRNVSLAAMLVLAISPHALLTASFQMSFAATAALVGVYASASGFLARRQARGAAGDPHSPKARPRRGAQAMHWLLMACLASAVAAAATAPFSAYHFQRLAPYGLIANVATMPLFSLWIMPLALVATIAMPFGLDGPFLTGVGWGLTLVFRIAGFLAQRFPDHPAGLVPLPAFIAFCVALLLACFLASGLRWLAVPCAALGLGLAMMHPPPPELLIFEDGRSLALLAGGRVHHMAARPSAFVAKQWERAFGPRGDPGFACEGSVCRALTASGLRIAWTDDPEQVEGLCASSDVTVVARAIDPSACGPGPLLVSLKTLRRSGSLAIARDASGAPRMVRSIEVEPAEWNMHRLAPWPEFWRKPPPGEARTGQ